MKKRWLLLLVGAFGCLFTAVNPLSAQIWTLTSAPTNAWTSVASSADGSRLVAAAYGGGIYTSTNSGATWTLSSAGNASWTCVASSADGNTLAAVSWRVLPAVYISTNSGATWNTCPVSYFPMGSFWNWSAISLSADGTKVAVAANSILNAVLNMGTLFPGLIYTSTNSGATWNSGPSGYWTSVACSADGSKLVAAEVESVFDGIYTNIYNYIYTSTNSGAAWMLANVNIFIGSLTCVASSADGTKLVAAGNSCEIFGDQYPGSIYTSPDLGLSWNAGPSGDWSSVASSADGTRLVAAGTNFIYSIYTSTDSGATWTQATNGPSGAACTYVASSADGGKLVAAVNGGGIYTSQATPAPVLTIAPSNNNLAFSWIVPSTNFVLQQNSDLTTTNWEDVTNTSTLNLINLQNQVALPLPVDNGFYRLKTP